MLFTGPITTDALGLNIRLMLIFPEEEIHFQLLHQTYLSWREEEITANEPFWVSEISIWVDERQGEE